MPSENIADSELFITRRRKKYKFAQFNQLKNCFQLSDWLENPVLPSDRAIVVEIGAGTGLFAVELARRQPQNFYIALDIKSDRLYSGARRASELKLDNIVFIRSEVKDLPLVMAGQSASQIWITFPDPYLSDDQTKLKKSDLKHSLLSARYLQMYQKWTGELHFKTDSRLLFNWSIEQLVQTGWRIVETTRDLHNSGLPEDCKIMTSYETRFVADGLEIYYLKATI
jgi:tRNA (guanine-N7-)-methyltransferase